MKHSSYGNLGINQCIMTSVLLMGAGLGINLIPYLKNLINTHNISLRVLDQDVRLVAARVGDSLSNCSFGSLDIRQIDFGT